MLSLVTVEAMAASSLKVGRDLPYAVLTDEGGQLSLEEAVVKLDSLELKKQTAFSSGYTKSTFWLKFKIPEANLSGGRRLLEVGPNYIDDIKLYRRTVSTTYKLDSYLGKKIKRIHYTPWVMKHTGDTVQRQTDLDYRNSVFVVPPLVKTNQSYEFIVRIKSTSTLIFTADLWKPIDFFENVAKGNSFWGFYFGIAALSTFLVITLALLLGSRLLWSAVGFSTTFILIAAIQGYIGWLIPHIGMQLQHYLTSVMTITSFSAVLWLCSEAINFRQQLPKIYKLMISLSIIKITLISLIPLELYNIAITLLSIIHLLGTLVFIYCIFYLWWRASFDKTVLAVGIVPFICVGGSLFGMFPILGLVEYQQAMYAIWQYSTIALVIFVVFIAVHRVKKEEIRQREKDNLANQLKAEQDASFHQRQYMGIISHEFRTPLAVVSGCVENLYCLEKTQDNPRVDRYKKIRRAVNRLTLLTDNCLADARLSAEKLYLDKRHIGLFDLVQSASELVSFSNYHHFLLTFNGKPFKAQSPEDQTLCVDAAMIKIALSNIIDNAVKYSAKGLIKVDCAVVNDLVVIHISDQGPGISKEDVEYIFERYRRGKHNKEGSGLGLYSAREIALAHGGNLIIDKTSALGTCFKLTIKLSCE